MHHFRITSGIFKDSSFLASLTKPCVLSFSFSHGWCCMSPNKLARAHCWTGPGCLWRVSHSSAWRCLNVRVTGPWKGGRPLSPPDLSTMPCTMTSTKSTMMLPRLEVCGLTVGPRRVYSPSVSQDIWHQPAATTCTKIAALTLYRPSKCPRHGLLPVEVGSSTHIMVCSSIALHSIKVCKKYIYECCTRETLAMNHSQLPVAQ